MTPGLLYATLAYAAALFWLAFHVHDLWRALRKIIEPIAAVFVRIARRLNWDKRGQIHQLEAEVAMPARLEKIEAWSPLEREALGVNDTDRLIERLDRELAPPAPRVEEDRVEIRAWGQADPVRIVGGEPCAIVAAEERREVSIHDPDTEGYLGTVSLCCSCGGATCDGHEQAEPATPRYLYDQIAALLQAPRIRTTTVGK